MVHNISINENRAVKRIAISGVILKMLICRGIITVTYVQVKAKRTVLMNPALRRNNNDLNGHSGRLYNNVNNTAVITYGTTSGSR
jgi:hypothetical protein